MNQMPETDVEEARPDTATRILDAAERTFRHYGYNKTTVADIAGELGMSTANIYRFFGSKVEIHQAICARMLGICYKQAYDTRHSSDSAEMRLRRYIEQQHRWTVETMLDEHKVHEMIIVAIERDWQVIERHIDRVQDLVAEIIREGIATGEFAEQDPVAAARCFGAATVSLCHPQMVAQCMAKENRATTSELVDFAIRALKR